MSETDSFIQEVSEEVRKDRMFSLWKKWGPFVIGGIAIIVGAAGYWSWNESQLRTSAETRGGTFIAADPQELDQQLALVDKIDGPAKLLAEFSAAGSLARDGRNEEAAARYAALAERTDLAPEYADLARLQQARLTGGSEGIALLDDLTGPDRPYRLLALELRGAFHLGAGSLEAAHADWRAVFEDPAATAGLRQRAVAAITATGGELSDASG